MRRDDSSHPFFAEARGEDGQHCDELLPHPKEPNSKASEMARIPNGIRLYARIQTRHNECGAGCTKQESGTCGYQSTTIPFAFEVKGRDGALKGWSTTHCHKCPNNNLNKFN